MVANELPSYFGAGLRFDRLVDDLPWRSDPHLARCLKAFPGLRLLRQPLEETLLCFLCSSTKQIVQIKQMVELLAQRHGREIAPGIHRLPNVDGTRGGQRRSAPLLPARLSRALRQPDRTNLAANGDWFNRLEQLPYPEAKERLRELPGGG